MAEAQRRSLHKGILGLLLEDRHAEFPPPAVSPVAPNERPTSQSVHDERHEDEHRRIGQHGRPSADVQDFIDDEVHHCEEDCHREWGEERTGKDEQQDENCPGDGTGKMPPENLRLSDLALDRLADRSPDRDDARSVDCRHLNVDG